MDIQEQVNQQRVKYIVSSYRLDGDLAEEDRVNSPFDLYLDNLLKLYPTPLVELALVETLVDQWVKLPMTRGIDFLRQTHDKLKSWETQPIVSTVTPAQFQQITGLSPSPIFGSGETSSVRPIFHPS